MKKLVIFWEELFVFFRWLFGRFISFWLEFQLRKELSFYEVIYLRIKNKIRMWGYWYKQQRDFFNVYVSIIKLGNFEDFIIVKEREVFL